MARKKKPRVKTKDLEGFKYLELLNPFLERLQKVGTERDVAGNRELYFDQYTALILLFVPRDHRRQKFIRWPNSQRR